MNFSFLTDSWPLLAEAGNLAERNLFHDPNTSLIKLRMFGEILAKYLIAYEKLKEPEDGRPVSRLNLLAAKNVIPEKLLPLFHSIRKTGNKATHEAFGTVDVATNHLHFAHRIACWFQQTYGEGDFVAPDYIPPKIIITEVEKLKAINEELTTHSAQLEADLLQLQTTLADIQAQEVPKEKQNARKKASKSFVTKMKLSEAETRQLIDEQLCTAGWQAGTQKLRYSKGTRPIKGRNMAIAEWPTASGPADYALFAGLELVGVVEAKKKEKDVVADLLQAKRYARDLEIKNGEEFVGGPWNEYRVPFLFATNGRPYLS